MLRVMRWIQLSYRVQTASSLLLGPFYRLTENLAKFGHKIVRDGKIREETRTWVNGYRDTKPAEFAAVLNKAENTGAGVGLIDG